MENNKLKTYVITLSKNFMKGHPKAGKPTFFAEKFRLGIGMTSKSGIVTYKYNEDLTVSKVSEIVIREKKIHTIRKNYSLWEKRIKEVQEGKAILSIREWTGVPYKSKQFTIKDLTAADGVGIEKLTFNLNNPNNDYPHPIINDQGYPFGIIAPNDGLEVQDFLNWFAKYDLSERMAIIHFTPFRYGNE